MSETPPSIVGVVIGVIALTIFASYFFTSLNMVTNTFNTAVSNVTAIPYATSGPFGYAGELQIMNWLTNALNNPMVVGALLFLGLLMFALYMATARRRQ